MKMPTLEDRGRQIRALPDAGVRVPPHEALVNNGRHRTQSKRDLLAAVEQAQQESGRAAVFEAKF